MLIESEHSMALEDRDGSGIEMGFIGMPPVFFGEVFSGTREWGEPSLPDCR
jgi:hypothetical protein